MNHSQMQRVAMSRRQHSQVEKVFRLIRLISTSLLMRRCSELSVSRNYWLDPSRLPAHFGQKHDGLNDQQPTVLGHSSVTNRGSVPV